MLHLKLRAAGSNVYHCFCNLNHCNSNTVSNNSSRWPFLCGMIFFIILHWRAICTYELWEKKYVSGVIVPANKEISWSSYKSKYRFIILALRRWTPKSNSCQDHTKLWSKGNGTVFNKKKKLKQQWMIKKLHFRSLKSTSSDLQKTYPFWLILRWPSLNFILSAFEMIF